MELEQANWLIHEGSTLLDSKGALSGPTFEESIQNRSASPDAATKHRDLAGRSLTTSQSHLLREQIELRRRASLRFPDPQNWLWTTRSLAQASDWWCAKFKASLFPSGVHVTDGCCGAGVDLVALAMRGSATGIDRDPTLVALANANLRSHHLPPTAIEGELPSGFLSQNASWLHLDPDRRAMDSMDRRLRRSEDFSPSLSESLEMMRYASGAILKLAPATVIAADVESTYRNQLGMSRCWLGNLGECRQQLLLTGEIAKDNPPKGNANLTGQSNLRFAALCEPQASPEIISGALQETCSGELSPRRFIYDCHAVLHASQLQMVWANSVDAHPLGTSQGYFTSDHAIDSAWAQRFEVIDVLPWDQRRVKRWLREHRIGEVEVKKRLLQLDANEYQRALRGAGEEKITLLITRLGDRVRAVVARRG